MQDCLKIRYPPRNWWLIIIFSIQIVVCFLCFCLIRVFWYPPFLVKYDPGRKSLSKLQVVPWSPYRICPMLFQFGAGVFLAKIPSVEAGMFFRWIQILNPNCCLQHPKLLVLFLLWHQSNMCVLCIKHICLNPSQHTHIHIYIYICIYTYIYMYIYMYVCMYIYMCMSCICLPIRWFGGIG